MHNWRKRSDGSTSTTNQAIADGIYTSLTSSDCEDCGCFFTSLSPPVRPSQLSAQYAQKIHPRMEDNSNITSIMRPRPVFLSALKLKKSFTGGNASAQAGEVANNNYRVKSDVGSVSTSQQPKVATNQTAKRAPVAQVQAQAHGVRPTPLSLSQDSTSSCDLSISTTSTAHHIAPVAVKPVPPVTTATTTVIQAATSKSSIKAVTPATAPAYMEASKKSENKNNSKKSIAKPVTSPARANTAKRQKLDK